MADFDSLINSICNPSSSIESRSNAERALLEIFSDLNSWRQCLPLFFSANDTVCFFFGIGLQRLIWKHWSDFSAEDKETLISTITSVLRTRTSFQGFTRAKLEQVLTCICACSMTLQPVLTLVVDCDKPDALVGLSAIRTVLEGILSDEPKIDVQSAAALQAMAQAIVMPLTNVCCVACSNALQHYSDDNFRLMTKALEVMEIVICKLPLGAHVSPDVLALFFTLAECGADTKSPFHHSALTSIEILTDIMSKKFVPTSVNGGTATSRTDHGASILMQIVMKVVNLVKGYRCHGAISDSEVVMALLEFISVFSESHMERCVKASLSGGGSSVDGSPTMQQSVHLFFSELVAVTTASMDPKVLHKIASVWSRVISMETIKESVLADQAVCVPIVSHLLQASLVQSNPFLQESLEDMVEDLRVDLLADPHIKEILCKVSTLSSSDKHGDSSVLGAEEMCFIGSTLAADVVDLLAEFVESTDVRAWLEQTVGSLLGQNIALLLPSSPSGASSCQAAMDLILLMRIVPLTRSYGQQAELVGQVVSFMVQLCESRCHAHEVAREIIVLLVSCSQIVGQLLQGNLHSVSGEWATIVEGLFGLLSRGLHLLMSCGNPAMSMVTEAWAILFLQAVTLYSDVLDKPECGTIRTGLSEQCAAWLKQWSSSMSLEVFALLTCAQDQMSVQQVAQHLTANFLECSRLLEAAVQSITAEAVSKLLVNSGAAEAKNLSSLLEGVVKLIASMDAVTRNYSVAKPARRQALINSFTPLQTMMGRFTSLVLQAALQCWRHHVHRAFSASSPGSPRTFSTSGSVEWPVEMAHKAARLTVALNAGLLQCLGKKSFGKTASESLDVSVAFVDSCIAPDHADGYPVSIPNAQLAHIYALCPHNPLVLALLDAPGMRLLDQMLELAKVLAESTAASSPTVQQQVSATARLVSHVIPFLSDERVCAELLQPTLKAGIVSVRCYWQSAPRSLPFLNSISAPTPSLENSGSNVRPIVQLLTQLCVGSIQSSTVAPQDTLLALEGLLALSEQHQIFVVSWFQTEFWQSLFVPCLRVLLLRQLSMHATAVESLFHALTTARLRFLRVDQDETAARQHARDLWMWVAQEALKVAADYHCGDVLGAKIATALATHDLAALDADRCRRDLISPVAAEISRRM